MATDQLINKSQGDAIISGLTAIKNAISGQPVPTHVEDVVADAFDVGVPYVPGDYCIYENKLYICNAAHHGTWDGNDFTLTTVGTELESLNNALTQITTFNISPVTTYITKNNTWSGQCYKVGHLVFANIAFDIVANSSGQTIATIPSGFRPKYTQTVNLGLDGNLLRIDTNGNILGYLTTATAHLTINMVYYAD